MTAAPSIAASRGPLIGAGSVLAVPTVPARRRLPDVGAGGDELASLGIDVSAFLKAEKATGKPGEIVAIPLHRDGIETVLLAGCGDGTPGDLRRAGAAIARRAAGSKSLATTLAEGRDGDAVRALAEGIGLAAYKFRYAEDAKPPTLRRVKLVVDAPGECKPALAQAAAVINAVHLARDLANQPSLEKSPAWLAERAAELCEAAGLRVRVRTESELADEGFGGVLAVGRGSSRPPRLLEASWEPAGATRHVVLVGKGITFDSGGLSIKPPDGMPSMKTDMAGGAAVIATMTALAALGVTVKVTALVPMAENMPGSDAMRPGDVIRHYGGTTSEVLNTDAEGRLVLADALAYARAQLRPDAIVDIATLTGAAYLGLGKRHAACYATSDGLRDELEDAAGAAGERVWWMPLVEDYRDSLDSPIADLRNIGEPGKHYSGGSITAALFLREFVRAGTQRDQVPWAHFDVAGPARSDGDEHEVTKGATGFGVRTFLRWLEGLSRAA
ncbi:MAG TPA: leucyl aminopeptidase [Mycobacteriales bacterium]|nr:leucyl aminopeptidase [Mycobacteriales bacterium]